MSSSQVRVCNGVLIIMLEMMKIYWEKPNRKGYPDKILKQIGYYMPEERIEKEFCEVLFDSEQLLVLLTQNKLICQFENN